MATEIATRNDILQHYGQSLTPHERVEHRAWIGLRVEALLDPYWDKRPDDLTKRMILGDWMAALEAFTQDELQRACRQHMLDRCPKPKTGDIVVRIEKERAKRLAALPKPPEPEREPPATAEQADRIMRMAGRGVKRMGE